MKTNCEVPHDEKLFPTAYAVIFYEQKLPSVALL